MADVKLAADNNANDAADHAEIMSLRSERDVARETSRELQGCLNKSNEKIVALEASEKTLQ